MFGIKRKKKDLSSKLLNSDEASIFKQVAIYEAMDYIEASHKEDYEFMESALNKPLVDTETLYNISGTTIDSSNKIGYDPNTLYATVDSLEFRYPTKAFSTFLCCTMSSYLDMIENNEIDDLTIYYITDTNETYLGKYKIESGDKSDSEKENKIRITNCRCCGAPLPYTLYDIVKCEYCDVTQGVFEIIKEKR